MAYNEQAGVALVEKPVNVTGLLLNKTNLDTPLFNRINRSSTANRLFLTGASFELGEPDSAHQGVSEQTSLTAPEPTFWERENDYNVTQIFHETVQVSYRKMSNTGDMTDYNNKTADVRPVFQGANNVPNERDWQIANKMNKIKLDIENTILNGTFQDSKGAKTTADRTRGLVEAIKSNVVTASDAALNFDMIYTVAEKIMRSGSPFAIDSYLTVVDFVTFKQLQQIVANEGLKISPVSAGVNVTSIITPFGVMHFMPHRYCPAQTALTICMPVLENKFQPVPGKGNFFYEALSKTGASEKGQIYGQWGLDYGQEWLHHKITGIKATADAFTAPQRFVVNMPVGGGGAAAMVAEAPAKKTTKSE